MLSFVITGATSFIGSYLVRALAGSNYQIYAVIRPNSANKSLLPEVSNVKIIELDMNDYYKLGEAIGQPCDFFVHLAWNGTRREDRDDNEIQTNNYKNSRAALESLGKIGLKTFVTGGSQAEYGNYNIKIHEELPCNPVGAYGTMKLALYEYAKGFCKNNSIRLIEPRFFSIYGPGDFEGSMVMSILQKMLKNADCPLTEATQMWDFMYINDAVDALIKLMLTPTAAGVYNFASGLSKPLKEFIEEMKMISNSKSKLLYGVVGYPATGAVNLEACVDKLNKVIGSMGGGGGTLFNIGITNIIKTIQN